MGQDGSARKEELRNKGHLSPIQTDLGELAAQLPQKQHVNCPSLVAAASQESRVGAECQLPDVGGPERLPAEQLFLLCHVPYRDGLVRRPERAGGAEQQAAVGTRSAIIPVPRNESWPSVAVTPGPTS